VDGLPIGGGFRVPALVVSPWSTGGYVCKTPLDHTSLIRILERFTGVVEPNITPWRRKTFGDFTTALRFNHDQAEPPTLPDTSGPLTLANYGVEQLQKPTFPTASQPPPRQEPGRRPRTR
jgi:phospholipase C